MKPGKCVDRIERMRAVEREFDVAVMAGDALDEALQHNTALLTTAGLHLADFKSLRATLEATFIIRLFAEFETGIRDYWNKGLHRSPRARIRDIVESLASRRRILDAIKINVHAVRRYRNRLVHEEDADADLVSIEEARGSLCRFFGYLPGDW